MTPARRLLRTPNLGSVQESASSWALSRADVRTRRSRIGSSIRTVRSHLDRIRDRTGCRRRADLTLRAAQSELVRQSLARVRPKQLQSTRGADVPTPKPVP